jgi:hypothetical protein
VEGPLVHGHPARSSSARPDGSQRGPLRSGPPRARRRRTTDAGPDSSPRSMSVRSWCWGSAVPRPARARQACSARTCTTASRMGLLNLDASGMREAIAARRAEARAPRCDAAPRGHPAAGCRPPVPARLLRAAPRRRERRRRRAPAQRSRAAPRVKSARTAEADPRRLARRRQEGSEAAVTPAVGEADAPPHCPGDSPLSTRSTARASRERGRPSTPGAPAAPASITSRSIRRRSNRSSRGSAPARRPGPRAPRG